MIFSTEKSSSKPFANTLMNIEPPTVFAVDGPWGTGKTTFVRMLTAYLGNQGVKVVSINAWETDYVGDPLTALAAAFLKETEHAEQTLREQFKKTAIAVCRTAAPAVIRLASISLGVDTIVGNELGSLLAKAAEDRLNGFREDADAIVAFRSNLCKLAASSSDQPVVVIVDELDRCRPDYAVQAMEVIKHLFDVENVLFVLTVNRSQLDESVRTLYGTPKDPESYFRRFFDVELRLPPGDRDGYMSHLLRQLEPNVHGAHAEILATFLPKSNYGVRVIEQTMRHFNLVRSSLTQFQDDAFGEILQTAFLLRLVDQDSYQAFLRHEITDATLADGLFKLPWATSLRFTHEANLLEATLMVVAAEDSTGDRSGRSELFARYQAESDEGVRADLDRPNKLYVQIRPRLQTRLSWPLLTKRIEMLATE